jgi:oligoendopeptidase F
MAKKILSRSEVDVNFTWDLTALFKDTNAYNETLNQILPKAQLLNDNFKGKIDSAEEINACIDALKEVSQLMVLVGTYSSLSVSEDQSNSENLQRMMNFRSISAQVGSLLSFIENEISFNSEENIQAAIALSPENAYYLEDILRFKAHLLHPEVEKTLAALSPTLESPYFIYNQAKLSDLKFKPFEVDGVEHPLSFVLFEGEWEYDSNTVLRRTAFDAFSKQLDQYKNTIASAYQTQIQKEKVLSDLRGFPSVIDSLLFEQKVDQDLYNRQIDVIMRELAAPMRKYAKLLQRIHKLDKMTFADLKISVDPDFEPAITVNEARDYILKGLSVLGEDYGKMIHRAFDERWIDFVQNTGKSTGAFCSSPYGSHPYVLISWTERMRECFVLAHELGHAGHFYLANEHQNILNTRPSLYFIEAPSTMNEMLMANYLMKTSDDPRMKRWVLSSMVSRTYYHNFVTHLLEAAYQREVYRLVDQGQSVVAARLSQIKKDVLTQFWGDAVEINEGAELTWMRQPHYYMGLYPYTYSAGLTVATVVSQNLLKDETLINKWLDVLKAGGTKTPVELAQMVDVDITTEKPLMETIRFISNMIDEIEELTNQIELEGSK